MPQEDKLENPETPDEDANSITSESEDEDTTDAPEEDKTGEETSSTISESEEAKPDPDELEENKKKKTPITKEGIRQLIDLNIQGMTNQQIAMELNFSLPSVQKVISFIERLIKSDTKKRKTPITKKGIKQLIDLNQQEQEMNQQQIAKKLNVSLSSVQAVVSLIKKAEPIPKGKFVPLPNYIMKIEDKVQYVLIKHYNKYIPDEDI